MANESVFANIEDVTNIVWEAALMYMRTNFVARNTVTVFNNMSGMVDRAITEYKETEVTDNVGELDDLRTTARQVFDRDELARLTPKEIAKQIYLSDRRTETDEENVIADAAVDLGYTMGKKMELDILSGINSFEGGVIGSPTNPITLDMIFQARAVLEQQNIPGPYTCVLDPFHYLDIHADLTSRTNAGPLDVRNEAMGSYYITRLADISFIVSPNLPKTADTNEQQTLTVSGTPTGGTFTVSFRGWTTAPLAHNISAANLQVALRALPSINGANVSVGLAGAVYTVTFIGRLAGQNVPLLVVDASGLTGGTSPAIAVAETVAGVGYAVSGLYTRAALAFDYRRPFRIEPERRPSLRAIEMNATAIYAVGGWRKAHGVKLFGDATSPDAG